MSASADPFEILKSRFRHLSGAQQRVARMLLDEPAQVALLSTAALGERVGVSDSTVVRLASAIGYAGYPELRAAIHESLFRHVAPSEQFRRALRHEGDSGLQTSLRADAVNLGQMEVESIHNAIAEAASTVAAASAVYVAGSQSSFAPAYELYYLLGRIRSDVHLMAPSDGDLAHQLVSITPATAVVAFSVPRYSRDTYRVAKFAEDLGASLIAITDTATSPIAQLRSIAVTVSCSSASFFHSQVAPIAVANAIVAEVARRYPAEAEHRLRRHEAVDRAFGRLILDGEDQ